MNRLSDNYRLLNLTNELRRTSMDEIRFLNRQNLQESAASAAAAAPSETPLSFQFLPYKFSKILPNQFSVKNTFLRTCKENAKLSELMSNLD